MTKIIAPITDVGAGPAPDAGALELVPKTDAATPPTVANKPTELTKVRLLSDGADGKVNDVIEVDSDRLRELESAGLADSNVFAVAYALSLSFTD